MLKYILAIVGYFAFNSFWGALLGYTIGSFIDSARSQGNVVDDSFVGNGSQGYSQSGYGYQNPRNAFFTAFLTLSAHIIQADGKIMHSEMEVVRSFLRSSFGEQMMQQCNKQLLNIFEQRKHMSDYQWNLHVRTSCSNICQVLDVDQRIQLLAFLCDVGKADGKVDNNELSALKSIAIDLGLSVSLIDQMLNMGGKTLDEAYKVLGISPDATDDEVKKAYRKMALQYHPDRVASMGPEVQEASKRKFQEINDAKDRIYKARGL